MNRLFKLSGVGAYALAIGFTSGCPLGAKTVCELYTDKLLNKNEAQRLLGFSNNSGPLFILGTVGCSMLLNVNFGILLLICHYLGSILTGILLSFFRDKTEPITESEFSLGSALHALSEYRRANPSSFGAMLSHSVASSVDTIARIGGFILLFSVISGITSLFLSAIGCPKMLISIIIGIIEITNGCSLLCSDSSAFTLPILAGIISWGGFSIHAQSCSYIAQTDLSATLYMLSRLLHCIIAFLLALLLQPIFMSTVGYLPTFYVGSIHRNAFSYSLAPLIMLISILLLPILIYILKKIFIKSKGIRKKNRYSQP